MDDSATTSISSNMGARPKLALERRGIFGFSILHLPVRLLRICPSNSHCLSEDNAILAPVARQGGFLLQTTNLQGFTIKVALARLSSMRKNGTRNSKCWIRAPQN